jgi:hypothetical protein
MSIVEVILAPLLAKKDMTLKNKEGSVSILPVSPILPLRRVALRVGKSEENYPGGITGIKTPAH